MPTEAAKTDANRIIATEPLYEPLLSLIIPAYNEEAAIEGVLGQLTSQLDPQRWEIIVVNDGSKDATPELVARFPAVKLINHSINKGYGAAVVTGMRRAAGDFVVWFDADGQHRVQDLETLADELVIHDLDYCVGIRNKASHVVSSRKLGKWFLKWTVRLAAGRPVADFNSGLRGFKRDVISRYLHMFPKGFGASTTTTLLMLERGYLGGEVEITVLEREGQSSVSQIRDGFRTLMIILRIFLLFKPLQFFGAIGLTMILTGTIYGVAEALNNNFGFPVLASIVVVFGAQSLFFGLIADQLGAIRREKFETLP